MAKDRLATLSRLNVAWFAWVVLGAGAENFLTRKIKRDLAFDCLLYLHYSILIYFIVDDVHIFCNF